MRHPRGAPSLYVMGTLSPSPLFDADLLRVRKVRVSLRVQTASTAFRGADTNLFMKPGSALGGQKYIPDYRSTFELAPRNLDLAR